MSLLTCPNQALSPLLFSNDLLSGVLSSSLSSSSMNSPMLPYGTFTTLELEALRTKLNTAEHRIRATKEVGGPLVVSLTTSEVYTLKKMLDVCSAHSMAGLLPATPTALGSGFASQFGALAPYLSSPPATILDDAAVASVKGPMMSGVSNSNLSLSITPSASLVSSEKMSSHYHRHTATSHSGSTDSQSRTMAASRSHGRKVSSVPPSHYRCHRCGDPGHWLEDCQRRRPDPSYPDDQQDAPPESYVCHKCNVPGHWIFNCPLRKVDPDAPKVPPKHYICHKCGIPGHWIHDCPEAIKEHLEKHGMGAVMDQGLMMHHHPVPLAPVGASVALGSISAASPSAPFSPVSIAPRTVGKLKDTQSGSSSISGEPSSSALSPISPAKSTKSA